MEREKNVDKKRLVQNLPTQITQRIARKQGVKHKVHRAQGITVLVERVCPLVGSVQRFS